MHPNSVFGTAWNPFDMYSKYYIIYIINKEKFIIKKSNIFATACNDG